MKGMALERTWFRKIWSRWQNFRLSDRAREIIVFVITLACLFIFSFSVHGKITEHEMFVKGLSKVPVVGSHANFISYFVPSSEIVISILLLVPKTQRWGLYAFTTSMVIFTLYIGAILKWVEGDLPCKCNLIVENLSWPQHIAFNLGYIALAVFALWLDKSKTKTH